MRTPTLPFLLGLICISFAGFAQNPINGQRLNELPSEFQLSSAFDVQSPLDRAFKTMNRLNLVDEIPQRNAFYANSSVITNNRGEAYALIGDPKVSEKSSFTVSEKSDATKVERLDSDGDGVYDDLDICPNGDDTVDTDGDGIPDACDNSCVPTIKNFKSSILALNGKGSNSTMVILPNNSQNISFTISNADVLKSKRPNGEYMDEVTVVYTNLQGTQRKYGTFTGKSLIDVYIEGNVQTVTVSLANKSKDTSIPNLSVNLSIVDFCIETIPCDDADGDGVCDTQDLCSGFDDFLDTDGDGIPDGCDTCNDSIDTDGDGIGDCTDLEINSPCPLNVNFNGVSLDSDGDGVCDDNDICPGGDDTMDSDGNGVPDFCEAPTCEPGTVTFNSSTLGSLEGHNSVSTIIPANGQNVSFTISNIDERTSDEPETRYTEQVTINYIDGFGTNQLYGTFSGTGSIEVDIPGFVKSITVSLTNGYDGNSLTDMSVDLSAIDFCVKKEMEALAGITSNNTPEGFQNMVKTYPNPASKVLYFSFNGYNEKDTKAEMYDYRGQLVLSKTISGTNSNYINLDGLTEGLYILIIKDSQKNYLNSQRVIIER